jgi:hypothetical protein
VDERGSSGSAGGELGEVVKELPGLAPESTRHICPFQMRAPRAAWVGWLTGISRNDGYPSMLPCTGSWHHMRGGVQTSPREDCSFQLYWRGLWKIQCLLQSGHKFDRRSRNGRADNVHACTELSSAAEKQRGGSFQEQKNVCTSDWIPWMMLEGIAFRLLCRDSPYR